MRYLELFLELNPIPCGNVKNPYLILMAGISGTGKSTIARMIAEKINIVVLNNDKVRQFIYKTGFTKDSEERRKLVKKIQYYRIEQALKAGNNCILDGNISNDFEEKMAIINSSKIKYYIIRIIYDRDKVIERIGNRKIDDEVLKNVNGDETVNYSGAGLETFLRMEKNEYQIPNKYIYFEIDTSKDLDDVSKQVDKFIEKLKKENKNK